MFELAFWGRGKIFSPLLLKIDQKKHSLPASALAIYGLRVVLRLRCARVKHTRA